MMDGLDKRFDHASVFYDKDPLNDFFVQIKASGEQSYDKMHFVDFIPTAENLAKHWFDLIDAPLKRKQIKLYSVTVYETATSTATYCVDDQ